MAITQLLQHLTSAPGVTMNPWEVTFVQQLENQIGIPPIVLLPPFRKLPNVSGVADPDLATQFFQEFFKPGGVTTTLKTDDHSLPGELFVESTDHR
jgi:hypothetical protein